MESISNNLQGLSNSISLLDIKDKNIQRLLDSAQTSTRDLTNGYHMLGVNGEDVSKTSNDTIASNYKGIKAKTSDLFLSPKARNRQYQSGRRCAVSCE